MHPTPWKLGKEVRRGGQYINDAKGRAVVYVGDRATARLIISAVNSKEPVKAEGG